MMTGCGPPRSGWVMKVVVWPSLVGISICWSIMGSFFIFPVSRVSCLARTFDTIARKPEHDKPAGSCADNSGLEQRGPDRHCLTCRPLRNRPGDFCDDPDQQSVFRRDRPPDERRGGCC